MESGDLYPEGVFPLTAKTQQSSLNIINIFANKFFRAYMKGNFMLINIFEGILIPFVGTTLGAACVFL